MKEAFAMKRGELFKALALLWAFICIVYAAPALAQPPPPWTITVTTGADVVDDPGGDCMPPGTPGCSLREAIIVANGNGAPGDVIVFDSSLNGTTITLDPALGGLSIGNEPNTTIDATSLATGITIDASGIDSPLSLNSANITIQGPITITNAGGAAVALNPGADGSSLNNCIVRDNAGTGIYINASGTSISGCTVERNGNGGISVDSGGVGTTVSSTTIQRNTGGSGIYSKAQITVTGSTIIWNNPGGISLDVGANNSLILGSDISYNPGGSGIFLNGVSNITIGPNNTISYNFAEGVNVRNSSLVNINNSTISNNGQNGTSSGVFIFGTSNNISVFNNIIENNGGNGITVIEDFATDQAPTDITIQQNTIRRNDFPAVDGVGIQIAGAVSFVGIGGNEIYENAAQGILVERTPAGSNGPQNINIVPALLNGGALPNYIYSNGQEGILIRDLGTQNNVVRGNWIGVDPSDNPAQNGNSGVSLFGGTTNNTIEANKIRYNRYQDVLISGAGTSNNTVQNNTIWGGADVSPRVGYDNAGVVINNRATNNLVVGNNIAYHVFDGVQVVGPGTDDNVIGENQVYANGRGVVVINDYPDAVPPDPDAPPFDLQTDSFTAPGPARTQILFNSITRNNNDGILVRRDGGGTVIENNDISNNQADGIRLVGASPRIESNTITNNAGNGIHALVFFGEDDSLATANDDVLSQPTITGNAIEGNGAWGVLAIDTPLDLSTVDRNNSWPDPSGKTPLTHEGAFAKTGTATCASRIRAAIPSPDSLSSSKIPHVPARIPLRSPIAMGTTAPRASPSTVRVPTSRSLKPSLIIAAIFRIALRITSTSRAICPSMRIIVTMGISPIPQGSPAGRSSLPQAPASIAINLPD
jgi:CSLREA domain-containing protein